MYYPIQVAKTKALISFAVTAKLICSFVFAEAKFQFSHLLQISTSVLVKFYRSLQYIKHLKIMIMAYSFLSHLLIAGCDIGVQISVRPYVRSSVRSSVRSFVRQHLRRSLVFSTSEIAASLKPCIVIVPDIPLKHAP